MAWYNTPIRPLDPVIPDDQVTQAAHYVRDNFAATGQDSFTKPPAQDQGQWQNMINVQPVVRGSIERRWGYNPFATLAGNIAPARLASFQSDSSNQRNILFQSPTSIQAFNEDGTSFNPSLFTLAAPPIATAVRSLTSRSYQYFFDGVRADMNKWDGSAVGFGPPNTTNGVSNWGIDSGDITTTISGGGAGGTTFGPLGPGTVAQTGSGNVWFNPNGIKVAGGTSASVLFNKSATSAKLQGTNFGLGAAGTAVLGIKMSVTCSADFTKPPFDAPVMYVQLLKAGVPYGSIKHVTMSATLGTVVFGGASDLWGGSWTVADVNNVNFGAQIYVTGNGSVDEPSDAVLDFLAATVTVTPGAVGNSGDGVGIDSFAAGNVTLTVGRTYYLTPFNSITGHYGDISSASVTTGPITNQKMNLLLAVYNDPQVDRKAILATADGNDPSVLFQVAEVSNATTTFTDNTLDSDLILNQPLVFIDDQGNEFGCALNNPPPLGNIAIKHQGRLWMAQGQNIFFTKSVNELTLPNGYIAGKYEEAWPADNYFDVSQGAETVSGFLSDGQTLYIGTQSHVRRLTGNDPTNFSEPEIVHPEVGVLNQEVWQIVYMEGAPAGAVWLTPDFRVIQSDFNNYLDIGHPVQDVLNSINSSAAITANGVYVSDGEFELYILSIPVNKTNYADVQLVYDLRSQKWVRWNTTDGHAASLFNITAAGIPQWLFVQGSRSFIFQYQATATTDNGTAFPYSATTSWLHLGEPSKRKLLDEIEVQGDGAMTVSVYGASNQADFNSPTLLFSGPPKVGPFGQFKVFLASRACKYRYYQVVFQPTSTIGLIGYKIRSVPFNSL